MVFQEKFTEIKFTEILSLAEPKICVENFSVAQKKFVCMKFPVFTENRIFSVFADFRIKPSRQLQVI